MFNLKKLSKIQKIGGLFALIGAIVQGIWGLYSSYQILFAIFTALILFSLTTQIIDKKKDWLDIFAFLLPFVYALYQNTQLTFSAENIQFIMPLQLFSLITLYVYYGEDIFSYVWDKNIFDIAGYWKRLIKSELMKLFWFIYWGVPFLLFFFHLLMANTAYYLKDWVLLAHHLGISFLVGIILVDFHYRIRKSKLKEQKQLARYYFHIGLILFLFDMMLEEIKYLTSGKFMLFSFLINFIFIYLAFRPRISPRFVNVEKNGKGK